MYDWESSVLPHRCKNCGEWIKPRTSHVVKYGMDVERYCDPICAREEREEEDRARKRRDKLNRIIYGGEE